MGHNNQRKSIRRAVRGAPIVPYHPDIWPNDAISNIGPGVYIHRSRFDAIVKNGFGCVRAFALLLLGEQQVPALDMDQMYAMCSRHAALFVDIVDEPKDGRFAMRIRGTLPGYCPPMAPLNEVADAYTRYCDDVSRPGGTPRPLDSIDALFGAAAVGRSSLVSRMLSVTDPFAAKGLANARYAHHPWTGATPLHVAASFGHHGTVEVLLSHGADPNATMSLPLRQGVTPMHIAAKHDDHWVVRSLLSGGCFASPRDSMGLTPLHEARSPVMVDILVRFKAEVDACDALGMTPLHIAFGRACTDPRDAPVVRALLRHGADPSIVDSSGCTFDTVLCPVAVQPRHGAALEPAPTTVALGHYLKLPLFEHLHPTTD